MKGEKEDNPKIKNKIIYLYFMTKKIALFKGELFVTVLWKNHRAYHIIKKQGSRWNII